MTSKTTKMIIIPVEKYRALIGDMAIGENEFVKGKVKSQKTIQTGRGEKVNTLSEESIAKENKQHSRPPPGIPSSSINLFQEWTTL